MATVATCSFPISIDAVEHTPPTIIGRFFIPPLTWGFMTDVEDVWGIDGLVYPYFLTGSFGQEGVYSEPTQGQIWPRIG